MEFNEKVWLRAAIKGIRPIIEYKINTGEEIDFKGLVIKEKQNLRKWWEKENPLKSTRLSQDYRKFLAKLDTLNDLLEQSTSAIEIECRKSCRMRFDDFVKNISEIPNLHTQIFKTMNI